jgi:hypothetical protein
MKKIMKISFKLFFNKTHPKTDIRIEEMKENNIHLYQKHSPSRLHNSDVPTSEQFLSDTMMMMMIKIFMS